MAVRIRYMGNKREIAADVAELVAGLRPHRPLIDLFSGMCFVAGAIAPSGRQVWVNDIQRYAELVGRCLVATVERPPRADAMVALLGPALARNRGQLEARFGDELAEERATLAAPSVEYYGAAYCRWPHAANSAGVAAEVAELATQPRRTPYRLCTLGFAWGYFGLQQAIELDSVRYAIDRARRAREISACERRWALLALVQAASRLAASPGHLSQYLKATNESSLGRVVALRRRSAVAQFENELALLEPYGCASWRKENRVSRADALGLWPRLRRSGFRGAVVYADPPYTRNQYADFYHVLETVTRYDYPALSGKGRYRPDRFMTPFSRAREVGRAFAQLARGVAATDSTLVLSYPSNGMLQQHTGETPDAVLRRHFRSVELALRRPARHSSLGARHGNRDAAVEEHVYVAS